MQYFEAWSSSVASLEWGLNMCLLLQRINCQCLRNLWLNLVADANDCTRALDFECRTKQPAAAAILQTSILILYTNKYYA